MFPEIRWGFLLSREIGSMAMYGQYFCQTKGFDGIIIIHHPYETIVFVFK